MPSEEDLWERVWGNATADELSQYHDMLRKFARRLTSDPNEAEDLIQEGYISLYSAARSFDPERGLQFITLAFIHASRRIKAKWDERHRRGLTGGIENEEVPGLYQATRPLEPDERDSMESIAARESPSYDLSSLQEIIASLPRNPKWIRELARLKIDGKEDDEIMAELGIKGYRLFDRRVDRLERFVKEELIGPDYNPPAEFEPPSTQGKYARIPGGLWLEILGLIPPDLDLHQAAATAWWRNGMGIDEIADEMEIIPEEVVELLDEAQDYFDRLSLQKAIEVQRDLTPSLFADFESENSGEFSSTPVEI